MSSTGMHAPDGGDPFALRAPSGRGWRTCLVAGIVVTAAGLACMIWPGHSVNALVRIIALAMIASALGSIAMGWRSRGRAGSGMMTFSGVLLALVAGFMVWHPGLTGELIIMALGGAVLLSGSAVAALGTILHGYLGGSRWLQVSGIVGAVIGLVLLVHPRFGTTVMGVMIGLVTTLVGAALIVLAVHLRRFVTGAGAASAPHGAMSAGQVADRLRRRRDDNDDDVIEGDVIE